MKSKEFKLLCIAGLFSASSINDVIVKAFREFFGITDDSKVVSMDLEGCRLSDAKKLVRKYLIQLGPNTIIVGHSAGGQLATHFIDHDNVAMVVSICAPSHNPLDYPIWLLPKTAAYLWKTVSNQRFHLPDRLSQKLFGMTPPSEHVVDSCGHLVGAMNFGGLFGINPAPPKSSFGKPLLCVSSDGDVLITQKSVERTALALGGDNFSVSCKNHFPQLGLGAERRMRDIAKKAGAIMRDYSTGMIDS